MHGDGQTGRNDGKIRSGEQRSRKRTHAHTAFAVVRKSRIGRRHVRVEDVRQMVPTVTRRDGLARLRQIRLRFESELDVLLERLLSGRCRLLLLLLPGTTPLLPPLPLPLSPSLRRHLAGREDLFSSLILLDVQLT